MDPDVHAPGGIFAETVGEEDIVADAEAHTADGEQQQTDAGSTQESADGHATHENHQHHVQHSGNLQGTCVGAVLFAVAKVNQFVYLHTSTLNSTK